jgi:hypothetical protein
MLPLMRRALGAVAAPARLPPVPATPAQRSEQRRLRVLPGRKLTGQPADAVVDPLLRLLAPLVEQGGELLDVAVRVQDVLRDVVELPAAGLRDPPIAQSSSFAPRIALRHISKPSVFEIRLRRLSAARTFGARVESRP